MERMLKKAARRAPVMLIEWLFLIVFGFPFLFLLLTSFKSQAGYMQDFWALPSQLYLGNYERVFSKGFSIYFLNSIIISVLTVSFNILISTMASYAFAKIRFKLSKPLFIMFLMGMMIPVHTTLIPVFKLLNTIGLYDNKYALIGPYISFALPVSIFILTEFFREVPAEIIDAATIDGCNDYKIYWRIMLPLSTPAIATVGIYNFLHAWNEFIYALVLINRASQKTLPLGIREFYGSETVNIPAVLTAVLVGSLPVILFYLFAQERVINGLSSGAVKA